MLNRIDNREKAVAKQEQRSEFKNKKAEDLYKDLLTRNSKIQTSINEYSER